MNLDTGAMEFEMTLDKSLIDINRSPIKNLYAAIMLEESDDNGIESLNLIDTTNKGEVHSLVTFNEDFARNAVVSPDGNRIAFDLSRGGPREVYVMDFPEKFKN